MWPLSKVCPDVIVPDSFACEALETVRAVEASIVPNSAGQLPWDRAKPSIGRIIWMVIANVLVAILVSGEAKLDNITALHRTEEGSIVTLRVRVPQFLRFKAHVEIVAGCAIALEDIWPIYFLKTSPVSTVRW